MVIGVSRRDIRRMIDYPVPTYIVGVHERLERAFVVSVHGEMEGPISSITTGHELDCDTLKRLWDEVRAFWETRDMARTDSHFSN